MRQSFETRGGPDTGRQNLPKLRSVLKSEGLDGLYLPHEDEYQNEYQPEANQRLAWATGFTGSAGAALILDDRAYVFADGRYTIQVKEQIASELFTAENFDSPGSWPFLKSLDLNGKVIGYDPTQIAPSAASGLKAALSIAGATTKPVTTNPVDIAWTSRPPQPLTPMVIQASEYAGESSADKRRRLAALLQADKLDAALITAPHSLAWLFNVRGGDVACSPLPLGRAVLHKDGTADLFIAPEKLSDEIRTHLGNEVAIHDIETLETGLSTLSGKKVLADPATASEWFFSQMEEHGANISEGMDICALPKAAKNQTEIKGAQTAHERDAIPIARFLHWVDTKLTPGKTTEVDAVKVLEGFRNETGELKDISFETISGFGPNGAIAHYRVSDDSNLTIKEGSLFLVDSGGQYLEGTTDITRTMSIGTPTEEMRRHYTLVLKGHIALSVVRFPEGTSGMHLDILARHALWQGGFDYDHGTGHGVGAYLGVHEGPQRIAKWGTDVALLPGMIVSNEPGYYKPDGYGIRIENLQYVTPAEQIEHGDRPMMGFETLTLAPLAQNLIDTSLLTSDEINWIDTYHKRVANTVGPRLNEYPDVADWLIKACAPLISGH